MDGSELSNIHLNGWAFFASLVIFVCLIFLLLRLLKYINETTLFIFGLIFYILVGVYLIFHQNDVIRHDALAVLEAAKALNNGDIQSLTDISCLLYTSTKGIGHKTAYYSCKLSSVNNLKLKLEVTVRDVDGNMLAFTDATTNPIICLLYTSSLPKLRENDK